MASEPHFGYRRNVFFCRGLPCLCRSLSDRSRDTAAVGLLLQYAWSGKFWPAVVMSCLTFKLALFMTMFGIAPRFSETSSALLLAVRCLLVSSETYLDDIATLSSVELSGAASCLTCQRHPLDLGHLSQLLVEARCELVSLVHCWLVNHAQQMGVRHRLCCRSSCWSLAP